MYRRNILNNILNALSDTPVVFLRGARQTGKSTLVRKIANGPYPARYVTLDNAAIFSAASADPTGFLAGVKKPVVIDEAQRVRNLFLAIKEDVDQNRAPGRYLLTGPTNILAIPKVADALAARMELLTLWPLSISELKEGGENTLDVFFDRGFPNRFHPRTDFDLAETIVAGGFPEPVQRGRLIDEGEPGSSLMSQQSSTGTSETWPRFKTLQFCQDFSSFSPLEHQPCTISRKYREAVGFRTAHSPDT